MFDVVIIGSGLSGLNLANLLIKKGYQNICIIEKSNNIGGLIQTRHANINNSTYKYEAGGAVLFDYQKNMMKLVKDNKIEMIEKKLNRDGDKNRSFCDDNKYKKKINIKTSNGFYDLMRKVFTHMDNKGKQYCRRYTFEKICLEVLTIDEVKYLEICYGYSSEFKLTNSVVARKNLQNELFKSKKILFFKNGYSQLINSLFESIKNHITFINKSNLNKFTQLDNKIELLINKKNKIYTKKLVLAIPKQSLMKLSKSFTKDELDLLDSVHSSSLNRIFAKYDITQNNNKWMTDINYTTTDNKIKQIIPLNSKNGFFQISYSDWINADFWGNMNKEDTKKMLKKHLQEIFPDKKISDPLWIKKYYWKDAVHFWKPNKNEIQLNKKIANIRDNIFICGESYSLNQGWGEGAILSSIQVSKLL